MIPDNQPALPELPTPYGNWNEDRGEYEYTADQMRAYALESLRRAEGATLGEGA